MVFILTSTFVYFTKFKETLSIPVRTKLDISIICFCCIKRVRIMVFNATFNNISDISWRSVLLVEKSLKIYHKCCIEYTSPWVEFELITFVMIGNSTDCIGSCISNYHTMKITTAFYYIKNSEDLRWNMHVNISFKLYPLFSRSHTQVHIWHITFILDRLLFNITWAVFNLYSLRLTNKK